MCRMVRQWGELSAPLGSVSPSARLFPHLGWSWIGAGHLVKRLPPSGCCGPHFPRQEAEAGGGGGGGHVCVCSDISQRDRATLHPRVVDSEAQALGVPQLPQKTCRVCGSGVLSLRDVLCQFI